MAPAPSAFVARASFRQERQFRYAEGGLFPFNICAAIRLRGRLDHGRLVAALAALGARHESLRTTLADLDGEIVQLVANDAEIPLERVDAGTDLAGAEAATMRAQRALQLPFDRPSLLRVVAVSGPEEATLSFAINHAIADGWSLGVLFDDLAIAYTRAGEDDLRLAPGELDYVDVAEWERARTAPRVEAAWRRRLDGHRPRLALPGAISETADQFDLVTVPVTPVGADVAAALRRRARERGCTLPLVVTSALATVCADLGDRDVTFSLCDANRDDPALARVVGCVTDHLLVRIPQLDEQPELALEQVRDAVWESYATRLPYDRVLQTAVPQLPAWSEHGYDVALNCLFERTPMRDLRRRPWSNRLTQTECWIDHDELGGRGRRLWHGGRACFTVWPSSDGGIAGYLVFDRARITPTGGRSLAERLRDRLLTLAVG